MEVALPEERVREGVSGTWCLTGANGSLDGSPEAPGLLGTCSGRH